MSNTTPGEAGANDSMPGDSLPEGSLPGDSFPGNAVLFIRSRHIDDDREWLEPVQICCAFDFRTTLLLLGEAAADAVAADLDFEELHALDIAAVLVVDAAAGAHAVCVDGATAREVIHSHARVLHL